MHSLKNLTRLFVLFSTAACAPAMVHAQATAPASPLDRSFDTVLSRFEVQFVAVAQAMPSDKYDFTPATLPLAPEDFAGVRTFAAQVKHVAEMNFVIYGVMSGLKPDVDEESIRRLRTKDEILAALNLRP